MIGSWKKEDKVGQDKPWNGEGPRVADIKKLVKRLASYNTLERPKMWQNRREGFIEATNMYLLRLRAVHESLRKLRFWCRVTPS